MSTPDLRDYGEVIYTRRYTPGNGALTVTISQADPHILITNEILAEIADDAGRPWMWLEPPATETETPDYSDALASFGDPNREPGDWLWMRQVNPLRDTSPWSFLGNATCDIKVRPDPDYTDWLLYLQGHGQARIVYRIEEYLWEKNIWTASWPD